MATDQSIDRALAKAEQLVMKFFAEKKPQKLNKKNYQTTRD